MQKCVPKPYKEQEFFLLFIQLPHNVLSATIAKKKWFGAIMVVIYALGMKYLSLSVYIELHTNLIFNVDFLQ